MPSVTVKDLPDNCELTITVVISELVDIDDPNPPAEQPEGEERDNVWLVSKTSNQGEG
jgi:hypothetical protein